MVGEYAHPTFKFGRTGPPLADAFHGDHVAGTGSMYAIYQHAAAKADPTKQAMLQYPVVGPIR
jgi:hypothetical protein